MIEFVQAIADPAVFATVLRVMTPLLLAALGVLISDRAGVLNIGMEGIMLSGALIGVLVSAATANPFLGLFAALIGGGLLGALMAFFINGLGTQFIITGIALNMAALAATTLGLFLATGDKGMSGALKSGVLPNIDIPLLGGVPILGPLLSGHHMLTYVAILAVPAVAILLARTPFGLHIRAVGSDPKAAAAAGISRNRVQLYALALSGVLGGAAGAYLSMGYVSWFAQNMTAGRGFIALAAEVMGMGTAWGTFAAAAVLGIAETVAITMQTKGLPNELMQMIPYIVPAVMLTVYAARRQAKARKIS
jgi:simple sugar transport system permease protein